MKLHILQGGVENGDKLWILKAARKALISEAWIAPKSSEVGDDVVIYIGGYGFFATAKIYSPPHPRKDWINRWGAELEQVELIEPPISLGTIRRRIPDLKWAIYPRSIHTPSGDLEIKVRDLIAERRRTRCPDLEEDALNVASLDELRKVALLKSEGSLSPQQRTIIVRARSQAVRLYVLKRADGYCEGCSSEGPFLKPDGTPYLETHHIDLVSEEGADDITKVIAVCPTCHRRAHYAADAERYNAILRRKLAKLENR